MEKKNEQLTRELHELFSRLTDPEKRKEYEMKENRKKLIDEAKEDHVL